MILMKLKVLLFTLLISLGYGAYASVFQDETLHYTISYKWGLIHKDAGNATLSLKRTGDRYDIMLTAKSKPWADKLYQVRDTLKGSMRVSDLKPLSYAKITHEKGKYELEEIKYSFVGNVTNGVAKRYKFKGEKPEVREIAFSSEGPVYDMLSVFYYLRKLDFEKMNKDKVYVATIFSGKQKETIKIRSLGVETIKLRDKTLRKAYHIKFNFTRDGGKKSSEDMDTWISTDSSHIPLYLTAKLHIGEVRAYLEK